MHAKGWALRQRRQKPETSIFFWRCVCVHEILALGSFLSLFSLSLSLFDSNLNVSFSKYDPQTAVWLCVHSSSLYLLLSNYIPRHGRKWCATYGRNGVGVGVFKKRENRGRITFRDVKERGVRHMGEMGLGENSKKIELNSER